MSLSRSLIEGVAAVRRAPLVQAVAVSTLAVSLLLLGVVRLLEHNTGRMAEGWGISNFGGGVFLFLSCGGGGEFRGRFMESIMIFSRSIAANRGGGVWATYHHASALSPSRCTVSDVHKAKVNNRLGCRIVVLAISPGCTSGAPCFASFNR